MNRVLQYRAMLTGLFLRLVQISVVCEELVFEADTLKLSKYSILLMVKQEYGDFAGDYGIFGGPQEYDMIRKNSLLVRSIGRDQQN